MLRPLAILAVASLIFTDTSTATDFDIRQVELTIADYSEVVEVDDALDFDLTTWSYQPDVLDEKAKLPDRDFSIDLPPRSTDLVFSDASHAIAGAFQKLTVSGSQNFTTWSIHRFSLRSGLKAKPFEILRDQHAPGKRSDPTAKKLGYPMLMSIGKHGKSAILRTDFSRLDYWTFSGGGKHVAAWKPYGGAQSGLANRIHWAHALSDQTVLTLSSGGKLVRWKMPECKAIYQRELGALGNANSRGGMVLDCQPGLSVNHKHLAVWAGSTIILVDLSSGNTLGILGGSQSGGVLQPTFHWDGTQLACTEAHNFNQILVTYDLNTGEQKLRSPIPADALERPGNSSHRYGGFTWVGDDMGVIGGRLMVDLQSGRPVWKFIEKPTFTRPGPRFWYIGYSGGQSLSAVTLPHPEAQAASDALKSIDFFAAKPGSTISIESKHIAPDDIKQKLDRTAEVYAKRLNWTIADDQCVKLLVETEMLDTGKTLMVVKSRIGFGIGGRDGEEIPEKRIVLRGRIFVEGKESWSNEQTFSLSRQHSWKDDPDKTTEQEVIDVLWQQVDKYHSSLFTRMPGYITDPKSTESIPAGAYPKPRLGNK